MEISQQNRFGFAKIADWQIIVVATIGLLIPRLLLSEFQLSIASEMLIIGLFALSLNLILSYGGMVSFGHAAYYGIGGYSVAIGMREFGLNPWFAMMIAPFVSALFALVIGWFCVRRRGLYFAILTLAFAQLVYIMVFHTRDITGGDDGLHGLEFPEIITSSGNYYIFTVIVFIICYVLIRQLVRSNFVLILKASRENSERAEFIGVNVRLHQLIIFVIGGFFAGVAGALLVAEQHFVGVEMLFWTTSAEPILASLLGGMYILPGPAFGGGLLVFLELNLNRLFSSSFLSDIPVLSLIGDIPWQMFLGIITVSIVLLAPDGLLGQAQKLAGFAKEDDL